MEDKIEVLPPHGFVALRKWEGTELDIVNAAKVSFHREAEEFGGDESNLLWWLLKNKHGSPFEQGFEGWWHIRVPLFVMREWQRHRIGFSINEESGRYVELRPDFYVPETMRKQIGKPGAYTYEDIPESHGWLAKRAIKTHSAQSYSEYHYLISQGVAKEQARMVLPLNLFTEARWKCNARSLMNFLELRNSEDAQAEIRWYAEAMEQIFAKHMPTTHKAFVKAGRIAP